MFHRGYGNIRINGTLSNADRVPKEAAERSLEVGMPASGPGFSVPQESLGGGDVHSPRHGGWKTGLSGGRQDYQVRRSILALS